MRRQSDGTRQAARNRKQRAKGATAMVVMMMRYPTGFRYRLMSSSTFLSYLISVCSIYGNCFKCELHTLDNHFR